MRSRLTVSLVVSLTGLAMLGVTSSPAIAAPLCADVETAFCVEYSFTPASSLAADPLGFDVSFQNTSTGDNTSNELWLDRVGLDLLATEGSLPHVTRSDDLPGGLLIAGGGTCTGPAFTDCVAGNGAISFDISCCGGGLNDQTGTFGIQRITNVQPTDFYVSYAVDLQICLPFGGNPCFYQYAHQMLIDVPEPSEGDPSPRTLTLITYVTGSGSGFSFTGSLDSLILHFDGQSNTLSNGLPADKMYSVIKMPATCGTAQADATFISHPPTEGSITIPDDATVTDCPVASFSSKLDGMKVTLDGSDSTTPVGGRSLKKWKWNFGDGTTQTTTVPKVTHLYKDSSKDFEVDLAVIDSAGAQSDAATETLHGTKTKLEAGRTRTKIKASGNVRPRHKGDKVLVELLRKKDGEFKLVADDKVTLSNRSSYSTSFARPSKGKCRVTAEFLGDNDHLGSHASRSLGC